MKKVYQENVDKGNGDCARAVIASLFDKELHEVPEFKPDHNQGFELMKFFHSQGYDFCYVNRREDEHILDSGKSCPTIEEVAKFDGGINGYFYASVDSRTFEDTSHAVIVDINLNIVHDPNPNQLCLNLKPEDVKAIITVGNWHINLEGEFVRE